MIKSTGLKSLSLLTLFVQRLSRWNIIPAIYIFILFLNVGLAIAMTVAFPNVIKCESSLFFFISLFRLDYFAHADKDDVLCGRSPMFSPGVPPRRRNYLALNDPRVRS